MFKVNVSLSLILSWKLIQKLIHTDIKEKTYIDSNITKHSNIKLIIFITN